MALAGTQPSHVQEKELIPHKPSSEADDPVRLQSYSMTPASSMHPLHGRRLMCMPVRLCLYQFMSPESMSRRCWQGILWHEYDVNKLMKHLSSMSCMGICKVSVQDACAGHPEHQAKEMVDKMQHLHQQHGIPYEQMAVVTFSIKWAFSHSHALVLPCWVWHRR